MHTKAFYYRRTDEQMSDMLCSFIYKVKRLWGNQTHGILNSE